MVLCHAMCQCVMQCSIRCLYSVNLLVKHVIVTNVIDFYNHIFCRNLIKLTLDMTGAYRHYL